MLKLKQFLALAGLAALEAIRQPICLLLSSACVVLSTLIPFLHMYKYGEDGKLVRDGALALHFFFGVFIAGYAASSSLAREMRTGTASVVLSKPVSREVFFLSKFAGITVLILAFSACATMVTLLSERVAERFYFTDKLVGYCTDWQTGVLLIAAPFAAYLVAAVINYLAKRPFESTAFGLLVLFLFLVFLVCGFFDTTGHPAPFDFRVQWRIVPASLLVTMALIVLSAIAMGLSTRLTTVPTLTICSAIFLAGLMSDFLFGRNAEVSLIAGFLYCVIPNWQHFWVSDALTGGGTIPWTYILNAGSYALVYSAGILCLGIMSFRHAEMR